MRIITNPGSNLSQAAIERYGIQVMPQQIVVDKQSFDTRSGITHAIIDEWVKTAKEHPHVVGTTAAEFMSAFRAAAKTDKELLAIMTSRKVIGSHDAAVVAAKALREQPAMIDIRVEVVDTGLTDLAAGLACILAGTAHEAGMPLDAIVTMLAAFRQHATLGFSVGTFDYLVKGGRASAVRAFVGQLLGVRPLVSMVEGEVAVVEKLSSRSDPAVDLANWIEKRHGAGRRLWAGIFHGGVPLQVKNLARELRRRFDVAFLCTRELSPSIYLHAGPGALGVTVVPLDVLSFAPESPGNLD